MPIPKISVIIPCYNQAEYLDECLQSVLEQTFSDWECIIVNDGSPDNTEEIAKYWVAKDARFIYFKKENGGVSAARNLGIENAKGEWILPLDGDDKIAKQYLELASQQFENDFTVIYCQAQFFGERNDPWQLQKFNFSEFAFQNLIFCTAFFKKSKWEEVNGYDEDFLHGYEDWDFWIALLKNSGTVYQIEEICFFYRIKEISRSTSLHEKDNFKKNETLIYLYKKHNDFFSVNLPNIQEAMQENRDLREKLNKVENIYLQLKTSTRFRVGNKIISFAEKFIPPNKR